MQRWTVPIEVSNLTASWRRLTPPIAYASKMDRRASWLRYVRGGRPIRLPFARALRMPALTRSTIRLRSSSATAPRTVKTIFPVGVLVSSCSENEMKSMPRLRKVSNALSRCDTERANLSNFQQRTASKRRRCASAMSRSSWAASPSRQKTQHPRTRRQRSSRGAGSTPEVLVSGRVGPGPYRQSRRGHRVPLSPSSPVIHVKPN